MSRNRLLLLRWLLLGSVCGLTGCMSGGVPQFNPSGSLASRWEQQRTPAAAELPASSRAVSSVPAVVAGKSQRTAGSESTVAEYASLTAPTPSRASTSKLASAKPLRRPSSIPASSLATTSVTSAARGGLQQHMRHPRRSPANSAAATLVRAQSQDDDVYQSTSPLLGRSGYPRGPQPTNDATRGGVAQTTYQETIPGQDERIQVPRDAGLGPILPGNTEPYARGPYGNPNILPGEPLDEFGLPQNFADIDVYVQEAQSGRFMIGAGFNSDAGVTGQLIVDERNFDITRLPTSFEDVVNGRAFRGAGQGFRLELMPGDQLQRYLVSFSEPFLPYTQISMNVSGYYYDRNFFDWTEQRLGGRLAFGYRLTPDLSLTAATRLENVTVYDPRTQTSPELNAALGDTDLYIGQLTLTHDTRDHPFAPTEGHLIEMSYSQAFGTYDYPRGDLDYRRYFLVRERPDGSGRHTFSFGTQVGVTGAQTPVFENYFAGGVSSLRGFDFRGAGPLSGGVRVGGQFQWVNTVEYLFPVTADDMIRGVVFCDFGTVEDDVRLDPDTFRVAPGVGLRVNVPNFGGAPLAFDLAFPVARDGTDDIRNFSFFMGLLR